MPHPDFVPLAPTGTITGTLTAAPDRGRARKEVVALSFRIEYVGLVRLAYVVLRDRCAAEELRVKQLDRRRRRGGRYGSGPSP